MAKRSEISDIADKIEKGLEHPYLPLPALFTYIVQALHLIDERLNRLELRAGETSRYDD